MDDIELFLFDFDGTIVDTENIHYMSYLKTFQNINNNFMMSYDEYCEYKHGGNKSVLVKYFEKQQIEDVKFEKEIGKEKEKIFFNYVENNDVKLIDGVDIYLEKILLCGKTICIVTHSSKDRIKLVCKKFPILQKITYWITNEDYKHKKPHPECYIKAISKFSFSLDKIIAFEDSYNGFMAIKDLNINKVLINNSKYIYYDKIESINKFKNYNEIMKNEIKFNDNNNNLLLCEKIDKYTSQIESSKQFLTKNINLLSYLIDKCSGMIYLLGIGKNNHIAKKCASSWNSYGIRANAIYVQDLPHGDMGIFHKNDYLIYISNSGSTIELIDVAKYIKENFGLYQISVCNKEHSQIAKYMDIELALSKNKIIEADKIDMAPSVSSVILMMFFDLVGIHFAEKKKYTKEKFQLCHPGGVLGTKKPIDSVFVFAAGKGSRLKPYTNNIPKILVNIDNDNILNKIVNYWSEYTDNFVIIVNSEYKNIVSYYAKSIGKHCEIVIVDIEKQENSYTIKKSVGEKYYGKNILFTWCDIFPLDSKESDEKDIVECDIFPLDSKESDEKDIVECDIFPLDSKESDEKDIVECDIFPLESNRKDITKKPTKKIDKHIFSNKNIIFTYGNECRYKAENNNIIKCANGNIIGIYYFHNYKPLIHQDDTMDLCDCYKLNYESFVTYELESLVDIGDYNKYMTALRLYNNHKYKTRSFNCIEDYDDNKLIKYSLNQKGNEIIELEQNWYKVQNENNYIPIIYEYKSNAFVMEKLENYIPLYIEFNKCDKELNKKILDKIFDMLTNIHQRQKIINKDIIFKDSKQEFMTKIIDRINDIKPIIQNFEITCVNETEIKYTINEILEKLNTIIFSWLDDRKHYNIIHGDCQFSNTLYNTSTKELKFIDPRGYYGKTKLFGIVEYDYSKVLYAISGYDEFNNNISYIDIENKNIKFNIKSNLDLYADYFIQKTQVPKEVLLAMVVIHWIGLAQYNKNDIAKCINSYYYGIYLYCKYFDAVQE